jgi:hypothetical protein
MAAMHLRSFGCVLAICLAGFAPVGARGQEPGEVILRVAAFNLSDLRGSELQDPQHPNAARARRLAEVIRQLRPNIILLNEIAYDGPGAPEFQQGQSPGGNGRRFAEQFVGLEATEGQPPPLRYKIFTASVNSGVASGFDLDRNQRVTNSFPRPGPPRAERVAAAGLTSDQAREYAGDCWGFGTFPGQYGMALLVDERLEIVQDQIRTFRLFPWDYIPAAMLPLKEDGSPWFTEEERGFVRLSSRSHWDVPVKLPNGAVVHLLCSHPAHPSDPQAARRNSDEIRFWADYITGREYFVDDKNHPGPLELDASFVVLGTLNSDPAKAGEGPVESPIGTILFGIRRINSRVIPEADLEIADLAASDTTFAKQRVDYVLPSMDLGIAAAGVWRQNPPGGASFPSMHFPVWMEVVVPAPPAPARRAVP